MIYEYGGIGIYPKHTVMGVVSFKILNSNNEQIYQININDTQNTVTIKLNVIANILPSFLDTLDGKGFTRVYLDVSAHGAAVAFQYIDLPISQIKQENTNLVNLTYEFTVPSNLSIKNSTTENSTFKLSSIDIRLAFSNKSHHEMGFGETMRIGTFISTRIMVN